MSTDDTENGTEPATTSMASDGIPHPPSNVVLHERLAASRAAVEDISARFEKAVVEALAGVATHTVVEASATLAARLEFLQRTVERHGIAAGRAECHRAVRDICRWFRQLAERGEARASAAFQPQELAEAVEGVIRQMESLGTVSVPLDPDLFEPALGDGWLRRTRKSIVRRRLLRGPQSFRGVPLTPLARALCLPAILTTWDDAVNRAGALRTEVWRRFQLACMEVLDGLSRVEQVLASGARVAWTDVRTSLLEGLDQVRLDVGRFVEEIRGRQRRGHEGAFAALMSAASTSGTFLLPDRVWSNAPPVDLPGFRRSLRERSDAWNRLGALTVSELSVLLDGYAFSHAVRYALRRDATAIATLLSDEVDASTDASIREMHAVGDALRRPQPATDTEDEADAELLEARERIHGALRRTLLGTVSERQAHVRLAAPVAEMRRSLHASMLRIQGTFEVADEPLVVQEGEDPPEVDARSIELRSRARVLVVERIRTALQRYEQDARVLFERAEEGAREVTHIVDFIFEAARESGRRPDDGVPVVELARTRRSFVADGLPRAAERATALVQDFRAGVVDALGRLMQAAETCLDDFEKALRAPRASFVEDRSALASFDAMDSSPEGGLRQGDRLRFGHFAVDQVRTTEELATVLRTASFAELGASPLPENYWRLFSTDGAVGGQLRVAHASMLGRFRDIVADWDHGDPESIALTGVNGTGKASVVDQLLDDLGGRVVSSRLRIRERILRKDALLRLIGEQLGVRASSLEPIVEALTVRAPRRVFVLEAAERLFLRHPGGLDAIRTLLALISATSERVLWIVTFEKSAFDFLTNTLEVSEAFTNVMEVPLLTRKEVEGLVLLRHRMSGYRLRFDAREIRRHHADEAALKEAIFTRLHETGFGHPTLTLFGWLTAIREVSTRGEVVVGMPQPLPVDLLRPVAGRKCAALGALMLHGGLDRATLAQVMRIPTEEAGSLLGQLRHMHLVEAADGTRGGYRAHRVAFLPLYRELRERNVL